MSPKGFEGIAARQQELEARRQAAQEREDREKVDRKYFSLKNRGDSAVVRFLEQGEDVHYCTVHKVPKPDSFGWDIPCRDQDDDGVDCPGCDADLPKRFKGYINLINRETGEIEIWAQGITVFTDLESKDVKYKGLSSRDFEITRRGVGKENTSYSIEPADPDGGPQVLSAEDKKLVKDKYDLNFFVTPPSVEGWERILGIHQEEEDGAPKKKSPNPFV